ncbi:Uma2 family endonuclease [Cryomorpha ignava]|uniref:Uma2 family endonuclease n=1 Tax=Cryomorpha ignava TaxID=101383 RepID=A0A7K3WP12_9FLAO|nr:Uma2 family endonuclease [Cryomorpha ignava]NEN22771.1 Uma2 family endonuclease [Cryomorpha ignava]
MKNFEDKNQEVQEPDLTGTYTARDYISWKTDELMELIRGKVFKMAAAPSSDHQKVVMSLGTILYLHFLKKCEVYSAPFDVYLIRSSEDWKSAKNVVQPDLCVICDPEKIHLRGCIGVPDLVVEILSPSTRLKDLGAKRDLYEEYGVKEFWIVHPQDATLAVHVLENGKYRITSLVTKGQSFQSPTFPDLQVDLDAVFPDE